MGEEIQNWVKQAKRDLLSAGHAFHSKDYYVSAFFCQQAVEKGLKALYLRNHKEVLRIHDLVRLAREVGAPEEIIVRCSIISPVYVAVRYPSSGELPAKKINKDEAQEILTLTRGVLQWVKEHT